MKSLKTLSVLALATLGTLPLSALGDTHLVDVTDSRSEKPYSFNATTDAKGQITGIKIIPKKVTASDPVKELPLEKAKGNDINIVSTSGIAMVNLNVDSAFSSKDGGKVSIEIMTGSREEVDKSRPEGTFAVIPLLVSRSKGKWQVSTDPEAQGVEKSVVAKHMIFVLSNKAVKILGIAFNRDSKSSALNVMSSKCKQMSLPLMANRYMHFEINRSKKSAILVEGK